MRKIIKACRQRLLAGALSAVMLMGACPAAVFAEAPASPTPTPDPHGVYYNEAAATDALHGWPVGPSIEGQAAVVINLQNGGILYSKNADTVLYPASITKILTCLLACENLDMNMTFAMSQSAAFGIEPGSSSIYGDTDEVFTVEQAMMGLMLESANEMALMLGELVSGSEKKFVELMNERAAELGCKHTHFNNPNGLPDENHYTCAGDMAKIMVECWKNDLFRKFCTTSSYEIPPTNKQPETRYLSNHHKMMEGKDYAYEGVLGGKTGYTMAAGNTLVTFAYRDSMRLGVVVLNSVGGAYEDTAKLLDYGFGNFKKVFMNGVFDKLRPSQEITAELRALVGYKAPESPAYTRVLPFVVLPAGISQDNIDVIRIPHKNVAGLPWNEYVYYYEGNCVGTSREYMKKVDLVGTGG